MLRAILLLAFVAGAAFAADCSGLTGQAKATCFCADKTVYKYYADVDTGCQNAFWCYGPSQAAYVACSAGLLFSDAGQTCDWASAVTCSGSTAPSPPPPAPASPSPAPATQPSPSPSPAPATNSSCAGYAAGGGACGSTNGNLCCPSGQCCSKAGYCGTSSAHCGTGCQSRYGACTGTSTPSPSPSPAVVTPSPSPSPSPAPVSPPATPSPSPSPAPPASPAPSGVRGTLPTGPLMVAYYQSWSAGWASTGAGLDLAKIPSYVNVVVVSFAKPDCTYTKGSLQLTGTGLDFSSTGDVVRDAIALLKANNPNTRVILAVGGATYYNFAGLNTKCIRDIVDDFGFDGADLDYEPTNSNCAVTATGVTCATDAESVDVTAKLRAALPKGQYLLSTASWHVGMYGEGVFKASKPLSAYTGVNLAMAKSTAGQQLDLISIMAYDAGNTATTGFDWAESYRAHRALWKTQAVAIGVEIPPEAWGGNTIQLPEVSQRATYAQQAAGGAPYGIMLWSLHKQGCPNAQQITSSVCTTYGMGGCSTPLPIAQGACSTAPASSPSPSSPPAVASPSPAPATQPSPSPSPAPTTGGGSGSCSAGYAAGGGACGSTNGNLCCPSGQCCSQYGYCGTSSSHCGTGCQSLYGACTGTSSPPASSPSPAVVAPSPSPSPAPVSPPPSGGSGGTVADYITPALFESIFLHRNDPSCSSNGFYTYDAFVAAASAFPGFGTASADAATNKREIAAFLAQISHETTGGWATAPDGPYSWGLCWIQEGMKTPADQLAAYCAESAEYPCAAGKKYFGRGPIQISWNYNYIPAGQALGFDGLNDPDAVTRDAALAFKTAIWFWMTPRDPKPSCHDVMIGAFTPSADDVAAGRLPGFGLTTNIINGGLECGSGTVQGQEADRIGYFKRYAEILGTTTGDNLDCTHQQHY